MEDEDLPTVPPRTTAPTDYVGPPGAAELVIVVGADVGRSRAIDGPVLIGRDPAAQLIVLDEGVSRRHARIVPDGEHFVLEDLGSRNGTYLNGQRLAARVTLRSGDKIALGAASILLFTYHERYEEQVLHAQKLQALGQLASGVAHDFNNLVAAILGNAGFLRRSAGLTGDMAESLDEIETAARRAADLTGQLLSFGRRRSDVRAPVGVATLIEESVSLMRSSLPHAVEIATWVPDDLHVLGDASQLLQVLMNACLNSSHAMPHGGTVRIEAAAVAGSDAGRGVVRITIDDEGVGMDAATMSRAFEPFFSTKPRGEGTGLGLATIYRIVHDHGGQVWLDSRPGEGTRLTITLPAASENDTAPVMAEPIPGRGSMQGRVLVVDDEPLVRSTARRVLESAGCEVYVAYDRESALERATERIDLLIVDLELPADGDQPVFARLQAAFPGVPVIIATGYGEEERVRRLAGRPVNAVLPKPFDARSLLAVVDPLLPRRAAV